MRTGYRLERGRMTDTERLMLKVDEVNDIKRYKVSRQFKRMEAEK